MEGETKEVKELRTRNKELLLELKEKEMNNIKRMEEIEKFREMVQEMKVKMKKMQEMERDMERMQARIKELEQSSPKRKKIGRGSDADVESDATVYSGKIKRTQKMEWDSSADTGAGYMSPRCSWMVDQGPKKPALNPNPGTMNLEKKKELINEMKNNRERIRKEGTLGKGKASGKVEELERAWPMLPPSGTSPSPLPQRKPRERNLDPKTKEMVQQQDVELKPGFKLIENRVIKPGFRIITEGRMESPNSQERKALETEKEGESTANEWRENKSRKQKRRERREADKGHPSKRERLLKRERD